MKDWNGSLMYVSTLAASLKVRRPVDWQHKARLGRGEMDATSAIQQQKYDPGPQPPNVLYR